jgi:predicted dehydrogenase
MTKPVRIGVVGCGSVMQGSYMPLAEQLRLRGRVELVAACDVEPIRGQAAAGKFGIPKFSTDYRAVVEADDVDLVLVLTSMVEHGPIALAALEAGKHVLVEKPMAVNLEEAARLVEAAKTSPGYLIPAPHVIISPTFQAMWGRIHRGEIGKVLTARALYAWAGPQWGQWFYRTGGGPLFDLGVYNVTTLTGMLGPAKRVMAMTGTAIPERLIEGKPMRVETEDNAHVLIDFGESVFGVVTTNFTIQRYRVPGPEFYGTQGTIQMIGEDWAPEGYELWRNDIGAWQTHQEHRHAWAWTDGLRHMVECVEQGVRPIITPEHGYHCLEIMLKAMDSGRDGQAKTIESTFTPPTFENQMDTVPAHLIHDTGRSD